MTETAFGLEIHVVRYEKRQKLYKWKTITTNYCS